MGRNFIPVSTEDIADYINGEHSQKDMLRAKEYRAKTTNVYDRLAYQKEYEEYMREWTDYNCAEV